MNIASDGIESTHSTGNRYNHLGLIGSLINLTINLITELLTELRKTTNQPEIRKMGLWKDGEQSQDLQARLDAYIAEIKKQPSPLIGYEFSLPKPMRFTHLEIKNLSTRGGLKFDTEFDNHDFSISFHRKKLLRDALLEGEFNR